ncbi:MAG: serine/threonine-protein kinase PknK, partial [Deltaproteobacteria bacterium]|nr:serine/threonine-protein kinase PknK [Deltaproteobacteria bacterium]
HPLFIAELARHAAVHGSAAIGVARLEDALGDRIARLEPSTRRLLEIVALAGAPVEQEAAARAAGLEPSALGRHAQVLRVEHLARTSGPRGVDVIEPFHDRIRDTVLASVDAAVAPTLHLRLARALEATSRADPAALARHLRAAGEPERAAHYAGLGAEQATRALAFDRAADLYRLALALWPADDPRATAHRIALADVLMFGGRGAAAAAEYRAAARRASPELAIDLHRRAAQQLLLAGHLDDGLAALRDVLAAHDLPFPGTAARAGLAIAGDRLRLRLRGLGFAARPERELPARTLARVDVCYHASAALGSVDVMRGGAFAVRGLRLALAAGEPYRVARALAIYAAMRAVEGGPAAPTVTRLLARCAPVNEAAAHPHAHAILVGARGQAAFLAGRYREALDACTEAEALFRDHCPGATREVNTVRLWCARSLMQLGELQELARRTPALLRECRDRGDRYGDVSLRAAAYPLVLLCADDPGQARAEVAAAEAGWTSVGYHVQHYYALATRVAIALYVGDAAHARVIAQANARQVRSSLLSRIQVVRLASLELVGRAALAVAVRQPGPAVLRDVDRAAARIAGERMAWADPLAAALRAGAAVVRGRADVAAAQLAEAIAGFERADMALHAHVARWRRAALVGGADGERAIAVAASAMRAQGVQQPARMAALYLPWPDGARALGAGT